MSYSDMFFNKVVDGDFSTKMEHANFNGHPRQVITVGAMMVRNNIHPELNQDKHRHLGMLSFKDEED